jgi:predicted RNase H-like HicB family nuclease
LEWNAFGVWLDLLVGLVGVAGSDIPIGSWSQSMKREFSVVYTPIEDGWIMAQVPELPGAVTQGRDMDEAREMIQEAVELLLQSYRENAAKVAPTGAVWETLSMDAAV